MHSSLRFVYGSSTLSWGVVAKMWDDLWLAGSQGRTIDSDLEGGMVMT
jgi:hypothetical protein